MCRCFRHLCFFFICFECLSQQGCVCVRIMQICSDFTVETYPNLPLFAVEKFTMYAGDLLSFGKLFVHSITFFFFFFVISIVGSFYFSHFKPSFLICSKHLYFFFVSFQIEIAVKNYSLLS